ncbi:hypothetical protein [Umezawaea tangerina]|uniref:Uncharacterized protein n=1 Tax=Umezawaea tangerina TaxID=84725 RepID=A0A2T0TFP3_9PSEU|nr:hypothetical protein [Umezawaea tangerina]PRY44474.1 hypothetical protein CLV43_10239 [Umezawaea tangerina]
MIVLLVLNALVATAGTGFAVAAAVRPESLSYSDAPTAGERFYAWMYTARGVPLGVLTAVVPFVATGTAAVLCLVAAAVAQAADAGIGLSRGERRMVVGAGVATLVHVVTAVAVG